MTLQHALVMLWETLWALVLGFGVSAALQTFVSKERMSRAFGRTNLKTMAVATALGAASSSCSYAAAAAGRSAVKQGAALIPALAFMFASTNLVVELGAVLWLLMGWRFVLAEFVGAFVLIGSMWLLTSMFMPPRIRDEARRNAETAGGDDAHCHHHDEAGETAKLQQFASAFVMDWQMLWKEILGGFVIAGFLMAVVPPDWWRGLFLESGNPAVRLVENAIVGPLIAIASFVCSVGNIPLASLLWSHGISFGGVLSFIYADLLVVPLIIIYVKYYGARATVYIVAIFYAAMVLAGITVDVLFSAFDLVPSGPRPPSVLEHATIVWNYTTWLDLIALVAFGLLVLIHLHGPREHAHCH
jgi:uncharacterized membrane protein YraQ (UPF0718 family)